MATNAFLPFATAPGANVATAADYTANSNYAGGYVAGVATSKYLNFTWRQSSFMTAALGQMIADYGLINAVDDGSVANLETALVTGMRGATPGRLLGIRTFTASGTYNPTAGTKSVIIELVGSGGAGGGVPATGSNQVAAGSGGGGGGYARGYLSTGFSGQSMTIPGVSAGVIGAAGNSGSSTSFGGILSASGGGGGSLGPAVTASQTTQFLGGTVGGVGTGGNILNSSGGSGVYGIYGNNIISGSGGLSAFGAGGASLVTNGNGINAVTYGAGGGGSCLTSQGSAGTGGSGGTGAIIIWEFA